MQIQRISNSSYNKWLYCQMAYFLEYFLKYKSPSNRRAVMGNVVHSVVENLALCKKAEQDGKESIVHELGGELQVKMLRSDWIIKHLTDLSFDYYVKKHPEIDFTSKDKKEIEGWVDIVLAGEYNPRNLNIVDAELHFEIPIEEDWAKFPHITENNTFEEQNIILNGYIDLLIKHDNDVFEVADIKSGKKKDWNTNKIKTFEDIAKDAQLVIYYLAVKKLFPEAKTILSTLYYLADGGPVTVAIEEHHVKDLLNKLKTFVLEANHCVRPIRLGNGKHWKCRRWCTHFKNCDQDGLSICQSTYNKILKNGIAHTIANEKKEPC